MVAYGASDIYLTVLLVSIIYLLIFLILYKTLQRPTIIWTFWIRYTRKNLKTVWMKFNGKAACKLVADLAYDIVYHLKSIYGNLHTQSEVVASHATFSWCISPCKKSKKLIHCFLRYWWSKNPTIWLDDSILANNLWTRNFPDMGFAQENRELRCLSFLLISSQT